MDVRYYNKFIDQLLTENKDLKRQVGELQEKNRKLKKSLATSKDRYRDLAARTALSLDADSVRGYVSDVSDDFTRTELDEIAHILAASDAAVPTVEMQWHLQETACDIALEILNAREDARIALEEEI